MHITLTEVLAKKKGGTARDRLKEVGAQNYEPTNPAESGTYKAWPPGKSAQHDKALDSGGRVNAAVV